MFTFIYSLNSSVNCMRILKRCYSNRLSSNHYDVIIAGGGMVGTTLASSLGINSKLSNKKFLLLESSKELKWTPKEKYSNRVSALTPNTQKLMESIGAWKHISSTRYGPIRKMQVWDATSDAMITFNNKDLSDMVAYIVENDLILAAVNKVISVLENVSVEYEAKIVDYKLPSSVENIVKVYMENGNTYTCNLLLGADGAKSKVRQSMGVQYLHWDYNQMGVVATLKLSEPCENTVAWQRFIPTGPIALLPLDETHSSLVWTTTPEHAKKLVTLPIDQFLDELNTALWKVYPRNSMVDSATKLFNTVLETMNFPSNAVRQLPPCIAGCDETSRAAFPLGFGHATNYVAKGVALVGDAAHRVHPLAGQGVNLGFGDVACLSELLANAVYCGNSIGNLLYLKEYESSRQRHNIPTMLAIDGLQKLYNTNLTPIVVLRSLGLQFTHVMNPLKNAIIGHAMA